MAIKIGDTFTTKRSGDCTVIDYQNCYHILVKFDNTGSEVWTRSGQLRAGKVKDRYHKSVYGVGYLGEYDKPTFLPDGKGGLVRNREYVLWMSMLQRCYYEPSHSARNSGYVDCEVCERWHCMANFAEDIKALPGYSDWLNPANRFELDKDALISGNRTYCPEACQFITETANRSLPKHRRAA